MKKMSTFKNLIDFAYVRYKTKNAITIQNTYTKNINYFNYRFDIYSLARAISSKLKGKNVAIISENRYEFLTTYIANVILKNNIFIIDNNLNQNTIAKMIRKYNINTIFFSDSGKNKIKEICKNNLKKKKLNLVNFDSNNEFPIVEYEKLINVGRYIENYSIDNIPDTDENTKNIVITNLYGTKEYSQKDFLESAYIIGKNLKIKKKKQIKFEGKINTFYQIVLEVIIPLLYGLNIQYILNDYQTRKYDIEILNEEKNSITVKYKKNKYLIENTNIYTYVIKIEDELLNKKTEKETPNFILIKSNKREKLKESKKSITV